MLNYSYFPGADRKSMEQPVSLHWQSKDAYYTALLTPDLFGGWVLITAHGKREGRAGRVSHKPLNSYASGISAINILRKKRRVEGFILCTSGFMEMEDLNPHSLASRSAETSAVMRAFRNLSIAPEQQAILLEVDAATLSGYLDGASLADSKSLLARVAMIMAIHKALFQLFSGAPEQART